MTGTDALGRLLRAVRTRRVLTFGLVGVLLACALVFAGDEIGDHIDAIEIWIAQLGLGGILAFVGLYVVTTSLMLPESVLSIMAGALFGLAWGLAAVAVGGLLAAAVQYGLSRRLLRANVERVVASRPAWAAIRDVVLRDQTQLQLLVRLTPVNPATVSYLLGASGVRFAGFMLACVGLLPHLLIEVYFGYAAKHAVRMAGPGSDTTVLHDALVFGGFGVTLIVLLLISRKAHKAVMEAIARTAARGEP